MGPWVKRAVDEAGLKALDQSDWRGLSDFANLFRVKGRELVDVVIQPVRKQ